MGSRWSRWPPLVCCLHTLAYALSLVKCGGAGTDGGARVSAGLRARVGAGVRERRWCGVYGRSGKLLMRRMMRSRLLCGTQQAASIKVLGRGVCVCVCVRVCVVCMCVCVCARARVRFHGGARTHINTHTHTYTHTHTHNRENAKAVESVRKLLERLTGHADLSGMHTQRVCHTESVRERERESEKVRKRERERERERERHTHTRTHSHAHTHAQAPFRRCQRRPDAWKGN